MALFSLFGKKNASPDATEGVKEASPAENTRERETVADAPVMRESPSQRAHRDLARITAEKIDAIESEITRDILKSGPKSTMKAAAPVIPEHTETPSDSVSTDLFHTTLIRVDKETMILFKEDMDE